MTIGTSSATRTASHRFLRSTAAVFVGFMSVALLSLATDQVLHVLAVYPPWASRCMTLA